MDFAYQEEITVTVSLEEVTNVLKEKIKQEGLEVLSLIPVYETKDVHYGQYPFGESRREKKLVGFQAKVRQTKTQTP